jgi:hypothetical protein
MFVGTVLPQLALWELSSLHLVFSQHLDVFQDVDHGRPRVVSPPTFGGAEPE